MVLKDFSQRANSTYNQNQSLCSNSNPAIKTTLPKANTDAGTENEYDNGNTSHVNITAKKAWVIQIHIRQTMKYEKNQDVVFPLETRKEQETRTA